MEFLHLRTSTRPDTTRDPVAERRAMRNLETVDTVAVPRSPSAWTFEAQVKHAGEETWGRSRQAAANAPYVPDWDGVQYGGSSTGGSMGATKYRCRSGRKAS